MRRSSIRSSGFNLCGNACSEERAGGEAKEDCPFRSSGRRTQSNLHELIEGLRKVWKRISPCVETTEALKDPRMALDRRRDMLLTSASLMALAATGTGVAAKRRNLRLPLRQPPPASPTSSSSLPTTSATPTSAIAAATSRRRTSTSSPRRRAAGVVLRPARLHAGSRGADDRALSHASRSADARHFPEPHLWPADRRAHASAGA